jgi:hypothetical protein
MPDNLPDRFILRYESRANAVRVQSVGKTVVYPPLQVTRVIGYIRLGDL